MRKFVRLLLRIDTLRQCMVQSRVIRVLDISLHHCLRVLELAVIQGGLVRVRFEDWDLIQLDRERLGLRVHGLTLFPVADVFPGGRSEPGLGSLKFFDLSLQIALGKITQDYEDQLENGPEEKQRNLDPDYVDLLLDRGLVLQVERAEK